MIDAYHARRAYRRRPLPYPRRSSRRVRVVAAVVGALLIPAVAIAATNWTVGVAPGSNGQAKAGTISNLTITATASPAATNLLYPGGNGDVVVTISNPNTFPVTITGVNLPTNTTYAAGFSDSALSVAQAGCAAATPSTVTWAFATGVSGTSHSLTTALTVAASGQANNPLVVTLTDDAAMGSTAPLACAATYFSMPSLTAIAASASSSAATTSPATDAWTS
ncbi:MAG TPA: hypothetical protein VGN18_04450 [Jatrophihabitans sp.]|jgi:hypothetical protein|uniref:hypothetical protein n=1 Tax=Jatrophihabitans sp. TaxID=1932789 RepID=UPI002DFAA90C|nr:hypothetical protein [Jatrophihabitans sp.]